MQPTPLDKPIGYWIKKADDVLTRSINDVQQQYGMTRLSWQLLHTICTHPPLTAATVADFVSPFASVAEVQTVLSAMINQGFLVWNNQLDSVPVCTQAGQELHDRCSAQQVVVRQQAMQDISNEQYALTVETLQAIVANLEQTPELVSESEVPAGS